MPIVNAHVCKALHPVGMRRGGLRLLEPPYICPYKPKPRPETALHPLEMGSGGGGLGLVETEGGDEDVDDGEHEDAGHHEVVQPVHAPLPAQHVHVVVLGPAAWQGVCEGNAETIAPP